MIAQACLLKKDNSFKVYHKNIQSLTVELFKMFKELLTQFYVIFFQLSIKYNLRPQNVFSLNCVNITRFGLNFLRYFASKLWSMIPRGCNLKM